MGRRTASIAMAAVMLLSCLTAVAIASSPDADAAVELNQGDSWGYNVKLDADKTIEIVHEYTEDKSIPRIQMIHELLDDGNGNAITMDELMDKIKNTGIPGFTIESLEADADLSMIELMEVVSKDSNGYVVEFDNAFLASASVSLVIKGPFPSYEDGFIDYDYDDEDDGDDDDGGNDSAIKTVVLDNVRIAFMANISGTMYLNTGMDLVDLVSTTNITMKMDGKSNVEIVPEDDDGDDYKIVYHPAENLISESYFLKATQDSELMFDTPVQLFPDPNQTDWYRESEAYIHTSSYISSNLPIGIDNSYVDVDTDDIEYSGTTIPAIADVIPEHYMLNLEGISIFYPATTDPVLSADERDSIRGELNGIIGDIDDTAKDEDLTVKFLDGDDKVIEKLTKTVKYGSTIDMPDFPSDAARDDDDDDDDEVFIGWECGDIIWTSDMPIRSNMTFEPEFADRVTDKPTSPGASGSIVWEVDDLDDMIDDILDNDLVEYGNTLYIDVKDSNGKVLYSWTLSNKNADLNGTKLIPKIEGGDVPEGKDYITDSADGRDMLYLDFKASGAMPSNTVVNYNVEGKFANGSEVTIYYDNGTSLEYAGTSSVDGGTVDIPLTHCSSYVLFAEAPADGGSNTMLIVAGVIICLVVVVAVVFLMKKKSTA